MTVTLPPLACVGSDGDDFEGNTQTGRDDHLRRDTHQSAVVSAPQTASQGQRVCDTQNPDAPAGPTPPADRPRGDIQRHPVGGAPTPTRDQETRETQCGVVAGRSQTPDQAPSADLADPLLALAADVVDDLERIRVANENRLRQLTRTTEDKDGEERGFGLTLDNDDVMRLAALVAGMNCKSEVLKELGWERPRKERGKACCIEHSAVANLESKMKAHPLGPWVKGVRGAGEKQVARMLATIGDPYIRPDLIRKHEDGTVELVSAARPRLVSELWSYCGYGDSAEQVRCKGEKANWSDDARKRVHLVAAKCKMQLSKPCYSVKGDDGLVSHTVHIDGECVCSRYRILYDQKKAHYASSVHSRECNRCTGKGKPPAPIGSLRKAAHVDAMALRSVKKEILRDLWHEAKRIHEGE